MWNKPKDLANEWEQRSWQFAVERHQRLQETLKLSEQSGNEHVQQYCRKGIAEVEAKYPQLKQNPVATGKL